MQHEIENIIVDLDAITQKNSRKPSASIKNYRVHPLEEMIA